MAAGFLYTMLYNNRMHSGTSCMVVIYALLYCIINYTVVTIILNILTMWNIVYLPKEFVYLNDPYIPSLLLDPVCCVTMAFFYMRRHSLSFCQDCRLKINGFYERSRSGAIFQYESFFQLKNLAMIFGALSVAVWLYYKYVYISLSASSRDWYVFTWLTIIVFILNEVYFIFRYYNLYLDLKENDEIISQEELSDMTSKTYLRFYVICGNKIFFDPHTIVPREEHKEVLDTPFITKRSVNGIPLPEVRNIIKRMTGVNEGELRFYFGRKAPDLKNHSVLRYFYFLPGKPEDYDMPVDGEWMDFDEVKWIYSRTPGRFSTMAVTDLSRLATIVLTEKIFDEEGNRKSRIKSYNPSFNLIDVYESDLDFQDDKWIRISLFNSDTRFFRIKKFFRGKPRVR